MGHTDPAAQPTPVFERHLALITLGWGLIVLWPGFALFDPRQPAAAVYLFFAPEWVWGALLTLLGSGLLIGAWSRTPQHVRRIMLFLAFLFWTFTCFVSGYIAFAVSHGGLYSFWQQLMLCYSTGAVFVRLQPKGRRR